MSVRPTFLQDRGGFTHAVGRAQRHWHWARHEGIGRLIDEDQANPADRVRLAASKARWRAANPVAAGTAVPVFLVGVQRSGTNMVVRGLERAGQFEVHNESSKRAFDRYLLRSDAEVAELVRASRHAYVLFKPLCDSHRIGALADDLAGVTAPARILWSYRAVEGRVRSAVAKFGDVNLRAMRAVAEGDGDGMWQRGGLTDERMATLASFDWDELTPSDGAALFWWARNGLVFDTGLAGRSDVLLTSYEAILADPEAETRRVASFLGLAWRPELGAHVHQQPSAPRPLELHPGVRALCDDLHDRLEGVRTRPSDPGAPST